jgi:hypothetical protein
MGTRKPPASIHSKPRYGCEKRSPSRLPTSASKRITLHTESPKEASTVTQARMPAPRDSPCRRMALPNRHRTTKPASGSRRTMNGRTIRTRSSSTPSTI